MRVLYMPAGPEDTEANLEFRQIDDGDAGLAQMRELVGGFEIVRFKPTLKIDDVTIVLVVDDEGAIAPRPINWGASALYGTQRHGHYIYGDVFLAGEAIVRGEPDLVSFPDRELEDARNILSKYIIEQG